MIFKLRITYHVLFLESHNFDTTHMIPIMLVNKSPDFNIFLIMITILTELITYTIEEGKFL